MEKKKIVYEEKKITCSWCYHEFIAKFGYGTVIICPNCLRYLKKREYGFKGGLNK